MKNLILVLLSLNCVSTFEFSLRSGMKSQKCKPIEIQECKMFGYDHTRPIDMYSSAAMNYKNAKKSIEQLGALKVSGRLQECTNKALFLLCSVYSPICFDKIKEPIRPCRGVCNQLKNSCGSLLNQFGIELPVELKCEELPEHNSGVCIQPSSLITKDQLKNQKGIKNLSKELNKTKCDCKSHRDQKPRYKNYRKAHYVVEASITSRATLANGHAKVIVNVTKIYKSGKIQPKLGKMRLWSPSSCLCQNIDYDVSYIIIGTENKRRLVIDRKTFILPVSGYKNKIKKWKRKCEQRGKCITQGSRRSTSRLTI